MARQPKAPGRADPRRAGGPARGEMRRPSWRRWIEPWYLAYALQGATVVGLVPILLPLMAGQTGGAARVGLVMAAFNLGGLTAPVWGTLADRYRLHRWLLGGGLLALAAGLAAFPLTAALGVWLALALVQGAGSAAAATVANLFVVEAHPRSEWDERVGWLQAFYGGGQVVGLLLAGLLSLGSLRLGLFVAAGLVAVAGPLGWLVARTPPAPGVPRPVFKQPARHGEWPTGSPQHLFHRSNRRSVRRLIAAWRSPFALFLLTWFLMFAGSAVVFALYPVLMQHVFGVKPGLSSPAFAIAAGLGLALYSPAGRWSDRWGPATVLRIALAVRLAALLGLLGLSLAGLSAGGWPALVSFAVVVLAWSLLSVSGTALAAGLAAGGEGEGLGLYNAVTAIAGVVGAALGGWLAGTWGYSAALALAAAGAGLGLILALAVKGKWRNSPSERTST